jgi:phage shock protein A
MDQASLSSALDRAERALDRIERAAAAAQGARQRDHALRGKVQGVVAQLDEMIRTPGAR